MYTGLSPKICHRAWVITEQSVLQAADMGVTNKTAGTIVVVYPRVDPNDDFTMVYNADIDAMHENSLKYTKIAVAKARISWQTGLSSRQVQQDAPFLYREDMAKWGGSVIENGLIVAFSGVQAIFDEAIAGTMLRWIVALCQNEMVKEGGVMEMDTNFIGELPYQS